MHSYGSFMSRGYMYTYTCTYGSFVGAVRSLFSSRPVISRKRGKEFRTRTSATTKRKVCPSSVFVVSFYGTVFVGFFLWDCEDSTDTKRKRKWERIYSSNTPLRSTPVLSSPSRAFFIVCLRITGGKERRQHIMIMIAGFSLSFFFLCAFSSCA